LEERKALTEKGQRRRKKERDRQRDKVREEGEVNSKAIEASVKD
jgi:hypothetical protein